MTAPSDAATPGADQAHSFFGVHVPFLAWMDVHGIDWSPGLAHARLALRPELENSLGAAHGGVVCTLLDVAMAAAARSEHPDSRAVTIDLSAHFMRPGAGILDVVGRVLSHTRSLAFCEAEIRDQSGRLIAKGSGTFKRLLPGRQDGDG